MNKIIMNLKVWFADLSFKNSFLKLNVVVAMFCLLACQGSHVNRGYTAEGDTLTMKYAQHLTIVKHDGYTEVILANPWKAGAELHRYFLVPKGDRGNEIATKLDAQRARNNMQQVNADIVRTPIKSSVVFTSPHCQLMYELGCAHAIKGVCDINYINIKDIQRKSKEKDCGSSMQPDIERIIMLRPEVLLVSPFENSRGFGKLDKLGVPIIETADYMENSPLGRAEWMKFYGMLFGCRQIADSLFNTIENNYLSLKAKARKLPMGLSVLTERKMGNIWYVPGGHSTMGILLKDANAKYIFAHDKHSGSLAMSPEQILAKGKEVDVWAFKYFGGNPLSRTDLLQEYEGYKTLRAFETGNIYECNTAKLPYFELTSFHPEMLLREFVVLAHPNAASKFGKLKFYQLIK